MTPKGVVRTIYDLEQMLDSEAYLLFFHGSYGDVYPNFALLESFLSEYKSKVIVIVDEKYYDLGRRFNLDGLEYFYIKNASNLHRMITSLGKPQVLLKGRIYNTLPTIYPYLGELSLSYLITDADIKRLVLGLSRKSTFQFLKLGEQRCKLLRETFTSNGLQLGKTALVMPFTNSNSPLPVEDLINLAHFMRGSLGYDVAVNIGGVPERQRLQIDSMPLKQLVVPPDALCEVAELAGVVITVISGSVFPLVFQPHSARTIILMNNNNTNLNTPSEKHYFVNGRIWLGRDVIETNKILELYFDPGELCVSFAEIKGFLESTPERGAPGNTSMGILS